MYTLVPVSTDLTVACELLHYQHSVAPCRTNIKQFLNNQTEMQQRL